MMVSERISWCVAHTQPQKEQVAKQFLLEQGYQVYLPRFKKIRRHARKVDEVLVPLFPRYLFVGMDLKTARWRSINGTRGVSYLLMSNDLKPACVPLSVIKEIKSQEISEEIVPVESLLTFIRGEKVRILEGAFKDQIATFEELDPNSRVQLLLSFIGREINVTLPFYNVEAV